MNIPIFSVNGFLHTLLILEDTNSLHWHLDLECNASSLSFTIPVSQLLFGIFYNPSTVSKSRYCWTVNALDDIATIRCRLFLSLRSMIILILHTILPCLILNVTSLQNTLIFYHSSWNILPSGNITPSDYTDLPVFIADHHSTLFNSKIHSSETVEQMNLLHCQVNYLVIFSFHTS